MQALKDSLIILISILYLFKFTSSILTKKVYELKITFNINSGDDVEKYLYSIF